MSYAGSLTRIEFRYRVCAMASMGAEPRGEDRTYVWADAYEVREYRTYEGAKRCQRQWEAEGKNVLLQVAKVQWLTPEELAADQGQPEKFGGIKHTLSPGEPDRRTEEIED